MSISPGSVSIDDTGCYYVSGHVILDASPKGATQLMTPRMATVVDFADADLAGLAALGSGPCSRGV